MASRMKRSRWARASFWSNPQRTTALVACGFAAAACGGLESPPAPAPPKERGGTTLSSDNCAMIKTQARAVLQANCAGCHEAPNKSGALDYIMETDRLKSSGLLVPGDPENSRIYARIAKGEMPPQGQAKRPTNSDTT